MVGLSNRPDNFGWMARLLHWSTALLMLGLVWLGWVMVDLTYYDPWYNRSLALHKALGLLVFVLGVLTLGWRHLSRSPHPRAPLAPWERVAARAMHHTLFTLVLLLPFTGYLVSTSAAKPVAVFDWFEVPALIPVDSQLRDLAIDCHYVLAYALLGLVALHAAAALKHQFIDRDGTLARMLWRR